MLFIKELRPSFNTQTDSISENKHKTVDAATEARPVKQKSPTVQNYGCCSENELLKRQKQKHADSNKNKTVDLYIKGQRSGKWHPEVAPQVPFLLSPAAAMALWQ